MRRFYPSRCFRTPDRFSKMLAKVTCPTLVKVLIIMVTTITAGAAAPHTSSDAILAIAWSLRLWGGQAHCGIIIFDEKAAAKEACKRSELCSSSCAAPHLRDRVVCGSEAEVIGQLQLLVQEVDPDVVCGFDIQRGSIGYILDRCAHMR